MYATFPESQKSTWANFVFKLSQILKTTKKTFHIFCSQACKKYKKILLSSLLQLRLRHLISQFANNNKNV